MNFNQNFSQLYQDYAPRLLGALVSHLHQLDAAEDAMADAFMKANMHWQKQGWPNNPKAWLYRVALHAAYDRQKQSHVRNTNALDIDNISFDNNSDGDSDLLAPDQRLQMFFLCAHPSLSVDTQALLMLRYCALLSTDVIAKAFLLDADSLSKRLQRAKHKLQNSGIAFEMPDKSLWPERLNAVLAALEVLYDQSYADVAGGTAAESLARDAIQLATSLTQLLANEPEAKALLSIMLFCESRRAARIDANGCMIVLSDQDTDKWSMQHITHAAHYLQQSTAIGTPGPMQIRAAIHAAHARKKTLGYTPWNDIILLYQALQHFDDGALVTINLATAYAHAGNIATAWKLLCELDQSELKFLPAYHLAIADLQWRREQHHDAIASMQHALTITFGQAERCYLQERLQSWQMQFKASCI
jgi:RNA polymerase sigma-70 factor, ECF subfamily